MPQEAASSLPTVFREGVAQLRKSAKDRRDASQLDDEGQRQPNREQIAVHRRDSRHECGRNVKWKNPGENLAGRVESLQRVADDPTPAHLDTREESEEVEHGQANAARGDEANVVCQHERDRGKISSTDWGKSPESAAVWLRMIEALAP